ncbi:MAG: DUF4349 domain-containing protein [Blautia sp.]|nr:DUF4349 domain-containing protein [Lachnoclostridium sp.]MCM1212146.1 DUF4349 domain-containing protein [Blautia sp.]
MKKENGIRFHALLIVLITAVINCGCGSSGGSVYNEAAYDDAGAYDVADTASYLASGATADAGVYENAVTEETYTQEMETESGNAGEAAQESGRKLIKTVDLQVETQDYDTLIANLEKQITALGGYIEHQYQYNGSMYSVYDEMRSASLQVRIPVGKLEEFVLKVGEASNITNKEERVEDVTLQYVDLESHKKALITEQERLLELLERAETIEDIIAIEQRLSDVRYELESMESQLRTLSNLIEYSTVNLSIQEVERMTVVEEDTIGDRIRNGFGETLYRIGRDVENGFVNFVVNSPYLVIWAVILIIAFILFRMVLKKIKRRTERIKQETAIKEQMLYNGSAMPGSTMPGPAMPRSAMPEPTVPGTQDGKAERTEPERPE